jgi:hypothetical protein
VVVISLDKAWYVNNKKMAISEASLKNLKLNPIPVWWNGMRFDSLKALALYLGRPKSTVQDYFHSDRPLDGHYIDEILN